jgi:hypothetical protein
MRIAIYFLSFSNNIAKRPNLTMLKCYRKVEQKAPRRRGCSLQYRNGAVVQSGDGDRTVDNLNVHGTLTNNQFELF